MDVIVIVIEWSDMLGRPLVLMLVERTCFKSSPVECLAVVKNVSPSLHLSGGAQSLSTSDLVRTRE
jgi:hypothetical protein